MAADKTLKEQNAWLVRAAVIVHMLAFSWVALEPLRLVTLSHEQLVDKIQEAAIPGSISLAVIVLTKMVLLGLVPPNLRDRLVHLKWNNPLPGARAFSRIGPRSSRVNLAAVDKKYGPLPDEPTDQDRLFYRIYLEHREEIGVLDAHRSYLATRDIATMNILIFLLAPGFALWMTGDAKRVGLYALGLLAAYLLFAIAAKNYAQRLVQNVLACASTTALA
jgi:hypothetical protein